MTPHCYNRPAFQDQTYISIVMTKDGLVGVPVTVPFAMFPGCGAHLDVQDLKDGRGPLPLPVREGWACEGCRWRPLTG